MKKEFNASMFIYWKDYDNYEKMLNDIDFENESEDMQELITEVGARQDDEIYIGSYEFDNGYYVVAYLNSGMSNYYENIVIYDNNGNEVWCNECDYTLDTISVELESGIYTIEFIQYD